MGVALAHGEHAVHGVDFAPLVTGDDARRYTHVAHQHDESIGDVLAKTFLGIKPECIGGVFARPLGRQRVGVATRSQTLQHGLHLLSAGALHQRWIVQQLVCQFAGARVQPRRQVQIGAQQRWMDVSAMAVLQLAAGAVAQHIHHRTQADPLHRTHLQGAPARRQLRPLCGHFQRQQPLPLVWLQQHFVRHGGACVCFRSSWAFGHGKCFFGCPRLPLQAAQHRTPEIQVLPAGYVAIEPHAKGHAVIERQFGYGAHGHLVAQAGLGAFMRRKAPQRRKPRKQHEQRKHDRRAQQRHAQGNEQRLAQRRVAGRRVGIDQRGQQCQYAHKYAQSGQ